MSLYDDRAAKIKQAQELLGELKTKGENPNPDQLKILQDLEDEVKGIDEKIELHEKGKAVTDSLTSMFKENDGQAGPTTGAKSLGEHFAKQVGEDGLRRLKSQGGVTVGTDWFGTKAATDTHVTGGVDGDFKPWLTDVDTTLVRGNRQRPVIADLLGSGTVSGNAITYFLEAAGFEGGFETVDETGQKPQMHLGNPTPVTDPIRKIAAWFDLSDEMVEDLPFYVSEINNRGLYELAMMEESQLLRGDGTGTNILGLLNRDGIQTEQYADQADLADSIFRAMTKIQTATGLSADGVIINPADYQTLRLARDANDQYYGGGFFAGQYGNGGIQENPPIWGLRTVVTAAAEIGSPVVGAFSAAATVYRKGGVRVESTNSDQGKFTSNIITTRIEERIGLAVRVPSAVVQLEAAGAGGAGE